jgi:hypothetical protein
MNFTYLNQHQELFPSVIGITARQFTLLLCKFSHNLAVAEHEKAHKKPRKRKAGAGRKPQFDSDAKKLFFILFYYKVYPTFRLAQAIFELDKRNIQLWKEFLEPILQQSVSYQLHLPEIQAKCVEQVLTICPDLKHFITDSTERAIRRPKNQQKQKTFYSGKKKDHTVKNGLYVDPKEKRVLAITKTHSGKEADINLMRNDPTMLKIPPKSQGMGDLAYQGIPGWHPFLSFLIPQKKPKGKELSAEDKTNNKTVSSIRVKVEHVNAFMKHFNILRHDFRNRLSDRHNLIEDNLDIVHRPFFTIACLYNFSLAHQ